MIELVLLVVYLAALVPVAWLARRATRARTPHDFYLAGGHLGFVTLLFTLFATQYSGNTFLAFPGKAYRTGYGYVMSVTFMMAIVPAYLLYAPRLRRAARGRRWVTPGDYIHARYGWLPLTLVSSTLMVWGVASFLLAQLMAMGAAVEGFTGGRIPYAHGVWVLAAIILVYETLGGMRAVAWSDVLQGAIMTVGVLFVGGWLVVEGSALAELPARIYDVDPLKVMRPSPTELATWGSTLVLVGLGGAMYPQAIQRILAARSTSILRRSLAVMVFLPLVTVLFAYLMGLLAIPRFPGLTGVDSDTVMTRMLAELSASGLALHVLASLLVLGAVAAIMSTADSLLLTLSSIFTQDFLAKTVGARLDEARLLTIGKVASWLVMVPLVAVALARPMTLFRLLEIKFGILLQVAPAIVLGLRKPGLTPETVLLGMLAGTAIALRGDLGGTPFFLGVHAGVWGLIANLVICLSWEEGEEDEEHDVPVP